MLAKVPLAAADGIDVDVSGVLQVIDILQGGKRTNPAVFVRIKPQNTWLSLSRSRALRHIDNGAPDKLQMLPPQHNHHTQLAYKAPRK